LMQNLYQFFQDVVVTNHVNYLTLV